MKDKELKPMSQEEYYKFSADTHVHRKEIDERLQEYALLYSLYGKEKIDEPKKTEIRDFIDNVWSSLSLPEKISLLATCDTFFAYKKMGYKEEDLLKKSELEIRQEIGKEKFLSEFFGELTKEQIQQILTYCQDEYDEKVTKTIYSELYGKQR